MKLFVLAVCVTMAAAIDGEWEAFKVLYGKQYNGTEEIARYNIFKNNSDFVKQHNEEASMGQHSFFMEISEYSDLTDEEFRTLHLGLLTINETQRPEGEVLKIPPGLTVPDSIDWRVQGAVTPVKNQGTCKAGWAFSLTGVMEGQHYLAKGNLVSLSEQNLVDCSRPQGNMGCEGGTRYPAIQYMSTTRGNIDTAVCYPYTGKDGNCRYSPDCIGTTVEGIYFLPNGDEAALMQAVGTVGPVSVNIDASHMSFRHYHCGVYNEAKCSSIMPNHAVLVVGYGTCDGQDYWLVKNSWGTRWGMGGYILMSRNKGNQCGIASHALYSIVAGRDLGSFINGTSSKTMSLVPPCVEVLFSVCVWVCFLVSSYI